MLCELGPDNCLGPGGSFLSWSHARTLLFKADFVCGLFYFVRCDLLVN